MKPQPGDKVKLTAGGKQHFGVLLPSPTLEHEKTVLLKLDSGYNIGFKQIDVESVELVETRKEKKKTEKNNNDEITNIVQNIENYDFYIFITNKSVMTTKPD